MAIGGYRFAKSSNDKEKTKMSSKTVKCSAPTSKIGKSALVPSGDRGFTLIEMLLAVAIVSVLALLALPAYSTIKDKAREVRCSTEIRELERGINAYSIDKNGEYPATWAAMGIADPIDPWGNAYVISAPLREDDLFRPLNDDYDLYSKGPDGRTNEVFEHIDRLDDVIRMGNGGFVGTVRNILYLRD